MSDELTEKKQERRAFILLTVFMAPLISALVVAGYGFFVWITQIIAGPPSG